MDKFILIGEGKRDILFVLMKINAQLRKHLDDSGIQVIVEPSKAAIKTYNQLCDDGKNVAAGFHLSY